MRSLNELKELLEKYTNSSLNTQSQIIGLLKAEIGTFELRINEKTAIAQELHKQIKRNESSIDMKDNKLNSLKLRLNEIKKIKNDMNKKIKQYEDINCNNTNLLLTQREKCDLLLNENEKLMISLDEINRKKQLPIDSNNFFNEETVNNVKINQMTLLINQLENKKSKLQNQIKEDIATVKENKFKVLQDKLKRKKEKNNKLLKEHIKTESSVKELKEILNDYFNQSKEISNQLKIIGKEEELIKKNTLRKEKLYSNLLSNIQ